MQKRMVHILWTGGMESTYRVVELSKTDLCIQPHYIICKYRGNRKSKDYELRAIRKITEILQKDKRTKAAIMSPIIYDFNTQSAIDFYPDIREAGVILENMKGYVNKQDLMFSCYARHENLKLETGVRFSTHGSIGRMIDTSLLVSHPRYDDILMIDPEKGKEEWASYTIFKDFYFPKSLYHKKKSEEASELLNDGYGEVLKNVWSCYNPILGMPCGHCNPCRCAKMEGTGHMIPFMGNLLGAIRYWVGKLKKPHRVLSL